MTFKSTLICMPQLLSQFLLFFVCLKCFINRPQNNLINILHSVLSQIQYLSLRYHIHDHDGKRLKPSTEPYGAQDTMGFVLFRVAGMDVGLNLLELVLILQVLFPSSYRKLICIIKHNKKSGHLCHLFFPLQVRNNFNREAVIVSGPNPWKDNQLNSFGEERCGSQMITVFIAIKFLYLRRNGFF